MGFFCSAINLDKRKRFTKKIGIQDKIYAAMALGIPKFEFLHYIEKNCEFDTLWRILLASIYECFCWQGLTLPCKYPVPSCW